MMEALLAAVIVQSAAQRIEGRAGGERRERKQGNAEAGEWGEKERRGVWVATADCAFDKF